MNVLFVGDPHVVPSEFKDCWRLIDLIERSIDDHGVDAVVLLGDLYHNHEVINAEVMLFWSQALDRLRTRAKVIVVKGNHDQPNSKVTRASSLLAHDGIDGTVMVMNHPYWMEGVGFIPYASTQEQFVAWANDPSVAKCHTLICHNTFRGATYENGTPAHDFYEQTLAPQKTIISGHIHTPMVLEGTPKVIYPGAPRWRTVSDANVDRNLLLVSFGDEGIEWSQSISTADHCSPYFHLVDDEGEPLEGLIPKAHARYVIDIKGSPAWIKTRTSKYLYARIRTFPTSKAITLKESDGLDVSLANWIDQYQPANQTPKAILQSRLNTVWPLNPTPTNN